MPYKPPVAPYVGPPFRHSGSGNKPIRRIVLHGTVSAPKEGGARAIGAYFRSKKAAGSAHYIIDPGIIVQSAYDSLICWHAPPNRHSIGVEFCDWVGGKRGEPLPKIRWFDKNHLPMFRLGARLVAELCLAYRVPPVMLDTKQLRAGREGLCEHSNVAGAWKQSVHWDLGEFPRYRFAKQVRDEIAMIKSGSPTGEPITLDKCLPYSPPRPKGK